MLGARHLFECLGRRHVHDVERDVAGDTSELDRTVGRLRLELLRPGIRVVFRVAVTTRERLGDQHVDRNPVLGVHHHQRTRFRCVLHRPQNLAVVGVEDTRVGHEHLEAGDAFVLDEVRHCLKRFLVHVTNNLVEGVVDVAFASGFHVSRREGLAYVEPDRLGREVDDRGHASPGRSLRARIEVVGGHRPTERQRHMDMGIDATRHDIFPGRINHHIGCDAVGRSVPRNEDRGDRFAFDQHISCATPDRRDDRAALNQCGCHRQTPLSLRPVRRMPRGDGRGRTASRLELRESGRGRIRER